MSFFLSLFILIELGSGSVQFIFEFMGESGFKSFFGFCFCFGYFFLFCDWEVGVVIFWVEFIVMVVDVFVIVYIFGV